MHYVLIRQLFLIVEHSALAPITPNILRVVCTSICYFCNKANSNETIEFNILVKIICHILTLL